MREKDQIVELVKNFLCMAEKLFKDGIIDSETYEQITINKKRFLDSMNIMN